MDIKERKQKAAKYSKQMKEAKKRYSNTDIFNEIKKNEHTAKEIKTTKKYLQDMRIDLSYLRHKIEVIYSVLVFFGVVMLLAIPAIIALIILL